MNKYSFHSERLSLLGLRYKWKKIVDLLITNLFGILGPIILPPLHIYILYHFWHQYTHRVDRHYCTCSCWDTVFKGMPRLNKNICSLDLLQAMKEFVGSILFDFRKVL